MSDQFHPWHDLAEAELKEMVEYCRELFYTPKYKSGCAKCGHVDWIHKSHSHCEAPDCRCDKLVKEEIEQDGIRWDWMRGDWQIHETKLYTPQEWIVLVTDPDRTVRGIPLPLAHQWLILLLKQSNFQQSMSIAKVLELHDNINFAWYQLFKITMEFRPKTMLERLLEIKALDAGWLDGEGIAPDPDGIDWFIDTFQDGIPIPYIYPIPDGGIQLEWSQTPAEITLEIGLKNHRGEWHSLNLETDEEESKTLDLDDDDSWEWIRGRLSR